MKRLHKLTLSTTKLCMLSNVTCTSTCKLNSFNINGVYLPDQFKEAFKSVQRKSSSTKYSSIRVYFVVELSSILLLYGRKMVVNHSRYSTQLLLMVKHEQLTTEPRRYVLYSFLGSKCFIISAVLNRSTSTGRQIKTFLYVFSIVQS